MMMPIRVTSSRAAMIQNTELESRAAATNEPNGTQNNSAMVGVRFSTAMQGVVLLGGEIAIARLIVNPKKGAWIEAERSLEKSRISKVGAVAAMILLIRKTVMSMISKIFGVNFNVARRTTGPKTVTLIA